MQRAVADDLGAGGKNGDRLPEWALGDGGGVEVCELARLSLCQASDPCWEAEHGQHAVGGQQFAEFGCRAVVAGDGCVDLLEQPAAACPADQVEGLFCGQAGVGAEPCADGADAVAVC